MKDEIIIRKFKLEDKEKLVRILINNVPRYFAETEVDDYEEYINGKVQDYYVAQLGDEIIAAGGINYDKDRQLAKISWDIVDIPFQKQGIGRLLMKHRLEVIAAKKDIKSIIVRTSQHAYGFYEKMGFKLLERHKDYWAKGFDMYKMIYNN
ncbi:GNAT family N-acetyltransferase [Sphingobacterium rhinopitheci]|uniref:GNAT family N-acetyltransferase n=1 Tax=Sphingobacterium rhinopitheci TaxID=2781960 RepID=UPI001F517E17|nr:GNAT family N-acetyltransferase [Sphingobacterium rhinopitheci]MCI0919742.1 GNAT family N-acetyltransferase [Sphingobacterium rhinopitheci]